MDNDTGRSRGTQKYPRGLRCRQKGNAREKRRIGQVQQNKGGAFLPLQNASGVKAALNCWNESVRGHRRHACLKGLRKVSQAVLARCYGLLMAMNEKNQLPARPPANVEVKASVQAFEDALSQVGTGVAAPDTLCSFLHKPDFGVTAETMALATTYAMRDINATTDAGSCHQAVAGTLAALAVKNVDLLSSAPERPAPPPPSSGDARKMGHHLGEYHLSGHHLGGNVVQHPSNCAPGGYHHGGNQHPSNCAPFVGYAVSPMSTLHCHPQSYYPYQPPNRWNQLLNYGHQTHCMYYPHQPHQQPSYGHQTYNYPHQPNSSWYQPRPSAPPAGYRWPA